MLSMPGNILEEEECQYCVWWSVFFLSWNSPFLLVVVCFLLLFLFVLLQPPTTTPLPSAQTHKMASKNGDYQKEYNNKGKQTKGTRRAARDVTEELVIELTKALPMRALFYHHLFFSALIGSLPVLHQYYELCDQTPLSTPPLCCLLSPFFHAVSLV